MAENKTKPTKQSVDSFLSTVSEKRRQEAEQLIDIMQQISGELPVMWGPSIIGFGLQHYKHDSGREGDMGKLGFSPRKAAITIYFSEGFDRYGQQLSKLGKYKASVSCLYINKLEDIDLDVLHQMLQESFQVNDNPLPKPTTVEEYVAQIPSAAKPRFDQLRTLVKQTLPDAEEVLSYGIIGYKINPKSPRVFISGWKDHLGVYPAPKDPSLQSALKPYLKSKGSLWFSLEEPLPENVIRQVVSALIKG